MTLDPDLLQAYRETIFCVFTAAGELHIRVDQPSAPIDKLLAAHDVSSAAFITAFNPYSKVLSTAENFARQEQLLAGLQADGFEFYPGEGRDPGGEWLPEQSVLILAMDEAAATRLAQRYEQNAYVLVQAGKPAELLLV